MTSGVTSIELIYTIAQQLNASLDLTEVLGRVLHLVVEATRADRASLFILDEQGAVTHHILARPNQSPQVSETNVRKVMRKGLAAWIYEHRRGTIITNASEDERWIELPGDSEVTQSVLGVPLLYHDRVNGLLTLHHEAPNFFGEAHLQLATHIADQAAIAVENARLFTQVKSDHEALYALLRELPLPVLVLDDDQIIFHNRAAERALNINQTGGTLADIEGGAVLSEALTGLAGSVPLNGLEVRWPDERIFQVSLNDVPQHGLVVTLNDITTLKELNAMKTQFVETVSHDLKNPISQIRGFARLLEDEMLSEQGRLNLAQISKSANYMLNLIEDLLALAQIEAGVNDPLESCDLAAITEEVLRTFRVALSEKAMQLTVDLDKALVLAEPLRLSQLVANLVSNAVKYTPAGGTIAVEVTQEAKEVILRVADTGRGIPVAAQAKLFQKFYRVPITNSADWVEGTGLGLSIVKAIVGDYGGRVLVKSEVGAGSTFTCYLPGFAGE
jgi:two-component system NtrC family sensor kinase